MDHTSWSAAAMACFLISVSGDVRTVSEDVTNVTFFIFDWDRFIHWDQYDKIENEHRSSTDMLLAWWRHQMETFSRYWPSVLVIHRSPVNSPHKGQWRGALVFSSICAWTNGWVNNQDAGDLRRHRVHYDLSVMGNLSLHIGVIDLCNI